MPPITIYTTPRCAYCHAAKRLLDGRGLAYDERSMEVSPAGRAKLVKLTGRTTFPQVLVHDRPIGGYPELVAAAAEGELPAPEETEAAA